MILHRRRRKVYSGANAVNEEDPERDRATQVSMAPAAASGKRRCLVSEGVGCLKVFDIIFGPDRWQESGVSRRLEGKKIELSPPPQNISHTRRRRRMVY